MNTTYDYDKQQWISGPSAVTLRYKQNKEELALLESPRGEEYAKMIGANRQIAIAAIRKELAAYWW